MVANGSTPTYGPGGGGGGGSGVNVRGGNGYAGQVELIYTAANAPDYNILRFLLHVPSGGDTDAAGVMWLDTSGTVALAGVTYTAASSGTLTMTGYSSGGGTLFTSGTITGVNGQLLMVSMELHVNGSTVDYAMRAIVAGASSEFAAAATGTVSGTNLIGAVTSYHAGTVKAENAASGLSGTSVGHVIVQYSYEALTAVSGALAGHAGELAGTRFLRLCSEQGITASLVGSASDTPAMGPQPDGTLMTVLQQTEDLDRGLLFETMDAFGLSYRTHTNLTNQTQQLQADYSQAHLSQPFAPTEDDQLTRNVVTVSRTNGSSVTVTELTGPLSTQDPPNGAGEYTYSLSVNAQTDSQLTAVANQILGLGTVDDFRYPKITFTLTRAEVQELFGAVMALGIGDHLQVINPPSFLTPNTIDQLAFGFAFTLAAYQLTAVINCVPESPYEV